MAKQGLSHKIKFRVQKTKSDKWRKKNTSPIPRWGKSPYSIFLNLVSTKNHTNAQCGKIIQKITIVYNNLVLPLDFSETRGNHLFKISTTFTNIQYTEFIWNSQYSEYLQKMWCEYSHFFHKRVKSLSQKFYSRKRKPITGEYQNELTCRSCSSEFLLI